LTHLDLHHLVLLVCRQSTRSTNMTNQTGETAHVPAVPGDHEFTHIDGNIAAGVANNVDDFMTLVTEANQANEAEHGMGLLQAFKTYPKAMAWSVVLSSALIMEGYDTAVSGYDIALSHLTALLSAIGPTTPTLAGSISLELPPRMGAGTFPQAGKSDQSATIPTSIGSY
jgi:hypothetical protein